jgi:outer membrane protein OmpA-like peptidoglycan-associated protein
MTLRTPRTRAVSPGRHHRGMRARSHTAGRSRLQEPGRSVRRRSPGYRLSRRPPAAAGMTSSRLWRLLAVSLVAGAVGAAAVQFARARGQACPAHGEIIVADQVTQEEGYDPAPPAGLVNRADQLASCGNGDLILDRGAGQGGLRAGPAVSLRIYREPGQVENDPTARENEVRQLITRAFRSAGKTRVPGAGRDVIGLLATISAQLGKGQNDVWLSTLGLPTVNPANVRLLMAADPVQAAASVPGPLPSLHGARVHLVLSPPAGNQPRLNVATDAWRRQFMVDLLRRMGADVVSVSEVDTVEPPAPGAPPAPMVTNLPDPTPQSPARPRPHMPYRAKLDNSALFLPNSAHFTVGEARVLAELQPVISGWRRGLYSHITVIGHCARFGPADTAVLLSQQRAARIARLLRLHGVQDVTSEGVGFDQPLPPSPTSATNRVVVVTAYPKTS